MNPTIIAATIRHILSAIGGILVAKGWIDENAMAEIISGSAVVGATLIWSLWQKRQATKPAVVTEEPAVEKPTAP